MTNDVVLAAREVTKRVRDGRGRREVLHSITLELSRGEIVAVRGPSGSGKTTLLAVLGGLLLPTSGEVWIEGEPVSRLRDHHRAALRRHKVGYLFQDFVLIEEATALENVLVPLVPDGATAQEGVRKASQSLAQLGIGPLSETRVDALSGGERQRVALARALIHDPSIVLLDEPTAHLDAPRALSVVADLCKLAREGRAVLIASHDPRLYEADGISRVLELQDGRLA